MNLYLIRSIIVSISLSTICGQHYPSQGKPFDAHTADAVRSGQSPLVIPVAVTRHHPIEYVDYSLDDSEDRQPKTFHVDGGNIPLNIIFSPRLNHLTVADQNDQSFGDGRNEHYSRSQEEPVYMYHEVNTPVFEDAIDASRPCDSDKKNNDYYNYEQNWQSNHQTLCR